MTSDRSINSRAETFSTTQLEGFDSNLEPKDEVGSKQDFQVLEWNGLLKDNSQDSLNIIEDLLPSRGIILTFDSPKLKYMMNWRNVSFIKQNLDLL